MDESERVANDYLSQKGFQRIIHEPDGRIPPDFLVDGRVAVEVRRLNQNELTDVGYRGLEETSIPFLMRFKRALSELGPPIDRMSWFVSYQFSRPLPPWRTLRPILKSHLTAFRDNPELQIPSSVSICDALEIDFLRSSKIHQTFFVLGAGNDTDRGGFVLAEMAKNMGICIAEKTVKVAPYRGRYHTWWLVLVDLIGYGISDYDQEQLKNCVRVDHNWDKIVILDPLVGGRGFELT